MQELLQYKDRDRWYLPTFAADDAPDWNQGRFVRSRQLAPGIREVGTSIQSLTVAGDIVSTWLSQAIPDRSCCACISAWTMASQSFVTGPEGDLP